MPCKMRAAMIIASVCAMPQSAESRPNIPMAVMNTRTVPKRAASHPVSGTTMASATA